MAPGDFQRCCMKKYRVSKTFQEINEKIRQGKAVVVTAEEMIDGRRDGAVVGQRQFGPVGEDPVDHLPRPLDGGIEPPAVAGPGQRGIDPPAEWVETVGGRRGRHLEGRPALHARRASRAED